MTVGTPPVSTAADQCSGGVATGGPGSCRAGLNAATNCAAAAGANCGCMRSPPGRHPVRGHGTPRNASGHDSAPWAGHACRPPGVSRQHARPPPPPRTGLRAVRSSARRPTFWSCSRIRRQLPATRPGKALRRGRGRRSAQLAVGVAAGGGLALGRRHVGAEVHGGGGRRLRGEDLAERSPARRSTCRGEMRKLARSSRCRPCAWQPARVRCVQGPETGREVYGATSFRQ